MGLDASDGASAGLDGDAGRCAHRVDGDGAPTTALEDAVAHHVDAHPSGTAAASTTTEAAGNANFSSMDSSPSPCTIFDRHGLHGGPVTVATIRFPPPERAGWDDDGTAREATPPSPDRYEQLQSRGRVVFARGPWIESRPLSPHQDGVDSGASREGGKLGDSPASTSDQCFRALAFGGENRGSSTIEAVSGMIFPSSSSSLSYLHASHSRKRRSNTTSSSLISIVAYGGRRISFLTGGGLWNNTYDDTGISTSASKQSAGFVSISIVKTVTREQNVRCPYLDISDWIHDVRLLDIGSSDPSVATRQKGTIGCFLVAMGTANNNCEVWGFRMISIGNELVLSPTRLQCIKCDVRCMTYSLSFYGWDAEGDGTVRDDDTLSFVLPSLVAASGTVFGEIVVWGAVRSTDEDDATAADRDNHLATIVERWLIDNTRADSVTTTSRIRSNPSFRLKGHLGSVFSVKFGEAGKFIASTSDDRTVRLWRLAKIDQSVAKDAGEVDARQSARDILALESSHTYILAWTGWGHTARVWDVSFASSSSNYHADQTPLLVSAGEDGVARIWRPVSSKKEIAHPLRGHRCESVWTVDVCEGIAVTGGNDGCVKLFNLESRMRPDEEIVRSFVVPKDPLPASRTEAIDKLAVEQDNADAPASKKSRKNKKRKAKSDGQAICGMEFYGSKGEVQVKLLVATRAGGLFSLDWMSRDWTGHRSWSEQVVVASDKETMMNIDPSTGNCMGVHPSEGYAIIGTSEGWLVTSSIAKPGSSAYQKNVAFHAQSYRPAQSLSFLDDDNLLVFYARGSVIWFKLGDPPIPLHVMTLGTTGIPLSFAFNSEDQAMYIGDSRGNIAFFDLNQRQQTVGGMFEQKPSSLLAKAHAKEHVTGMTVLKSGVIVSVGNDGCMHQCTRDVSDGQLKKMMSIPVPNVTGLRHVWNVSLPGGEESVILGGYYGNDFVMLDSTNGYELFRVATGGRQRRQDFFFHSPGTLGAAILASQKDGSCIIDVHFPCSPDKQVTDECQVHPFSIGSLAHAETINDACWIRSHQLTFLLTGSNDCTVRLTRLEKNKLVAVTELPPHESCVRGVCSSRHPESNSTLLVTCGGKLSMEFYILRQTSPAPANSFVTTLCSYRALGKASIDHRMNAVRAIPLDPHSEQCHLVVAGDSDGNLHCCVVSEHASKRGTTIGTILKGNGRPVLCLELLRCGDTILAFVGTTGGEIAVWAFSAKLSSCNGDVGVHCLEGTIPHAAFHTFTSHQSGVNDLSVAIMSNQDSTRGFSAIVCSVGDDQSLSACLLEFTAEMHIAESQVCITKCAASALKAVHIITEYNFYRVHTTGHDEKISMWQLGAKSGQLSLKLITSSPLGTEGSCIACIRLQRSDGSVDEVVAVGGDGVEIQSFNMHIMRAAIKLREATHLLITTGAGFSADSGLQTYECAPAEYRDMCNPAKLTDDPYNFQRFWLKFTRSYLETQPHQGYELLDQWCQGRLMHLRRINGKPDDSNRSHSTPWWVYTSNVDSHFRRFNSFVESLCDIHGSALEFRCACGIGFSSGEPRLGKQWEQWNDKMRPAGSCKETTVQVNQTLLSSIASSGEVLLCSLCRQPMRPNVLMFHDTDENVLRPINVQRERYQNWEAWVEEEVAMNGGNLVILEMGCGVNVPAVRHESEEVLVDCAEKLQLQKGERKGSVCLIRINPKDAQVNANGCDSAETISIASKAASALQKIDLWLKAFEESQNPS